MSLADVVRNAVATVNTVVKDLQEDVLHEAWISQGGFGNATYAAAVVRKALVDQKLHQRRLSDGRIVEVKAHLTFLEVVPPNGAADRTEPIDTKDRITLADGTTGPIVDVQGLRDPGAGRPFLLEVFMGVER